MNTWRRGAEYGCTEDEYRERARKWGRFCSRDGGWQWGEFVVAVVAVVGEFETIYDFNRDCLKR